MKYYALTKEEERILKDYEAGDFVSEKQKGVAHAVGKGIPYQTLVSPILHQFGNS